MSSSAGEYAVRLLSLRAYSARGLEAKLLEKGYSEEEACGAVGRLLELGYLDDAAYCATVIAGQRARGYGDRRIARYLTQKGVDPEEALMALELQGGGGDENREAIKRYIDKRADGEIDAKTRDRLIRALIRRGFDYSDIKSCLARNEFGEE